MNWSDRVKNQCKRLTNIENSKDSVIVLNEKEFGGSKNDDGKCCQ